MEKWALSFALLHRNPSYPEKNKIMFSQLLAFPTTDKVGIIAFHLAFPPQDKIHQVFYISLLRRDSINRYINKRVHPILKATMTCKYTMLGISQVLIHHEGMSPDNASYILKFDPSVLEIKHGVHTPSNVAIQNHRELKNYIEKQILLTKFTIDP